VREVPSGTGRKERNVPRMRQRGKMRVKTLMLGKTEGRRRREKGDDMVGWHP